MAGLVRFYHVVRVGNQVTSISLYARATEQEASNGNEVICEKFADEEWDTRGKKVHFLLSEDELQALARQIKEALKLL